MSPDNAAFMVAAYVAVAVILIGYATSLLLRIRSQRRR
jgi:hypothetical protein